MVNWLSLAELFRKKFNRPNSDFAFQEANKISEDYLLSKRFHFRLLIQKQNAFLAFKIITVGGMLLLGSLLAVQQKISIGQFLGAEIVIVLVIASIEKILFSLSTIFDTLTSMQKALSFQENTQSDFTSNEENKIQIEEDYDKHNDEDINEDKNDVTYVLDVDNNYKILKNNEIKNKHSLENNCVDGSENSNTDVESDESVVNDNLDKSIFLLTNKITRKQEMKSMS